jgi:hypothetical protein
VDWYFTAFSPNQREMEALRASAVDSGALQAERSQRAALETAHATLQA